MNERTVRLTLEDHQGHRSYRQIFVISLTDNGAEIRRSAAPIVERDQSVVAYLGTEPNVSTVVLRVEEML